MIRLKGDLIVNDNSWEKLLKSAYGTDLPVDEGEWQQHHSDNAEALFKTFDDVCRKHSAKKDQKRQTRPEFPRHIWDLLAKVKKYSTRTEVQGVGRPPEEIDVIRLAHAKQKFKTAKKKWEIRHKEQFYRHVVDDFVAHDHKKV